MLSNLSVERQALLAVCSRSLIAFAIAQWHGYKPADHHRRLANALERVENGTCKRLMIFMPPRHGKSMLASEFFPAWYMGRNPEKQVIHATYGQEFAEDWGRKIRNHMADPLFAQIFGGVALAADSRSNKQFHTTSGGVYNAVGVEGAATGRGAHLLIIDDPIKGREEAESETYRRKLRDWYTAVAYTRLMTGGAIVLIQTRWHEDDLAGWLQADHAHENWEIISMPALSDDQTPLWAEAYPVERLLQIKDTVGPRDWEALYQQRPRPVEGGEFLRSWIQYYTNHHRGMGMNKIMLVDPASGKRTNNDYTSIWVLGLGSDDNVYVLDMVRDRLNLAERAQAVFDLHRRWKPYEVRYEQYGLQADIEHLKSKMELDNRRFSVVAVGGGLKKEDRIRRIIPLFQDRKVYFPAQHWYTRGDGKTVDLVAEFIEQEYLAFPSARHDDMMDSLSRLLEPGREFKLRWPARDSNVIQFEQPAWAPLDAAAGF